MADLPDTVTDTAGVRFPPPLVFIGFLLLGPLLGRAFGNPGFQLDPTLRLLFGAVLTAVGGGLIYAAMQGFRRAGTRPEPWKPSSGIVARGLYGYTRNPMYLGMAITTLGLAVIINSATAMLLLPVSLIFIQTHVIAREEAYLDRSFGEAYRAYRAAVPRWL